MSMPDERLARCGGGRTQTIFMIVSQVLQLATEPAPAENGSTMRPALVCIQELMCGMLD